MKKIVTFFSILFLSFEVFSQVQLDNLKLKKLGKNEYLDYIYLKDGGDYNLRIFKSDEEGNLVQDLFFINHQYGNIQISGNRKLILVSGESYYESPNPKISMYNYYLIDGLRGEVKCIGKCHQRIITSQDFKYFLAIKSYTLEKGYEIEVKKIDNGKLLRTFYWKTGTKANGGLSFLRSVDFDYDFRIIYTSECSLYGECFYRVKDNTVYETFNDTFDEREYINEYVVTSYENGEVAIPGERMKNENWEK